MLQRGRRVPHLELMIPVNKAMDLFSTSAKSEKSGELDPRFTLLLTQEEVFGRRILSCV